MSWLYYRVYDAKTMRLLAQGNKDECAAELGYRRNSFQTVARHARDGLIKKYVIDTYDMRDTSLCPCWVCKNQPEERRTDLVSYSCKKPFCERWNWWARQYLRKLRRKYWHEEDRGDNHVL